MAYFAWVRNEPVGLPGTISPQIIRDEGVAKYAKSQGHLNIIIAYPLTEEEEKLTLDELIEIYPPPQSL